MSAFSSYLSASLFSNEGRVVLVTGGGSGLGRAIAHAYAANGATVYIVGRRLESLNETKELADKELAKLQTKGSIKIIQGSLSSKEDILKVKEAFAASGEEKLDTLINNAGVMRSMRGTCDIDDTENLPDFLWDAQEWDDFSISNDTNVAAVYFTTVAFLPFLKKSDSPNVTVTCSIAAYSISRKVGSASYGPSKAAAIQLTNILASRLIPFKIRVNAICPGLFPSEMTQKTEEEMHNSPVGAAIKTIPLKRPGREYEIAGPVLLLSSPGGQYIDGATLIVDGGRLMTISADN